MFLKTGELKKMMKSALKGSGLNVGNIDGHYLVYATSWGLLLDMEYASNKFKAAIIELIGDMPDPWHCYKYTVMDDSMKKEAINDYPDIRYDWKNALRAVKIVPLTFRSWPHEYTLFQIRDDHSYRLADVSLAITVIGGKERAEREEAPGAPTYGNGNLYWKNDSGIYWAAAMQPGEKCRDILFPAIGEIDFFEDDWIPKVTAQEASSENLPY